jgi:glutathione S-transferase
MSGTRALTFFHAPNTRSTGVAILLEELGAPHETRILNMKAGEHRQPAYLAINPMGKVPAILVGDALTTEQVAIYIHLADLFPAAGLAPGLTDPLRGPYLRWIAFYGSSFEPAIVDKALKREPGAQGMSPYGTFDATIATLAGQLAKGPYILGETFTAADILWGTALKWTMGFKIVPELPEFTAYVARVCARPAFAKVAASDAALAEAHEKAAAAR